MIAARGHCVSLTAILLLAGRAASGPDDSGVLRYKFHQGEIFRYVLEQKTTMSITVGSQDLKYEIEHVMDLTWEFTKVDKDGKAVVTQKLDRVRMREAGPKGKGEYDSKDGKVPDSELLKQTVGKLKDLIGGEITMVMDSRGAIDNVKPSDKFAKVLQGRTEGNSAGFAQSLVMLWDGEPVLLPKESLTTGEAWAHKNDIKVPGGKLSVDTTLTYDGPTEHTGRKVEKLSLKINRKREPFPNAPVAVKTKSDAGVGVAYFDKVAGCLVAKTFTHKTETESGAGDTTVMQKIKIVKALKLVEKKI